MPRARNIKHDFFTNEELADLDPYARLLAMGLMTLADRDGRLEYRPRRIRAQLFPYEPALDVESRLEELCGAGFIDVYLVEGAWAIQIQKWAEHQNPHPKEKPSDLPDPGKAEKRLGDAAASQEKQRQSNGTPQVSDSQGAVKSHGKAGTSREKSPESNPSESNPSESNPSESNPSESNPSDLTTLSGSPPGQPDDAPPTKGKSNGTALRRQALEVLGFLNEKAGKRFEATDANLDFIKGRLREGRDVQTLRMVIAMKCREWKDDEHMRQYLRPATLFNKSKCAQYVGELGSGRRDHG